MLLNLSNHPSAKWSAEQREAATQQFGSIVDIQFPAIDPATSIDEVKRTANEYAEKCRNIFTNTKDEKTNAVHLMGEYTFTYQFVKQMEALSIQCVASTTERIVTENSVGSKTTVFKFVQFRPYFTV
jgi:hypothetical protein